MTPYTQMYKICRPWLSLHFFVTFIEKNTSFNKGLWCFHELVKLQSLERLDGLCVSDVIQANEQTKYVNCGLRFVNKVLFYDEKGSF